MKSENNKDSITEHCGTSLERAFSSILDRNNLRVSGEVLMIPFQRFVTNTSVKKMTNKQNMVNSGKSTTQIK
jgi:hypothetical protein